MLVYIECQTKTLWNIVRAIALCKYAGSDDELSRVLNNVSPPTSLYFIGERHLSQSAQTLKATYNITLRLTLEAR